MIQFTKDDDDEIALKGCEFWNVITDYGIAKDALRPHLPALVPLLLDCMVYSEEEQYILQYEQEDTDVPDQPQDIEPVQYKSFRDNSDFDEYGEYDEDEEDDEEGGYEDYSDW
eukprot:CAMPEP_0206180614 /NCGR_PEP_ID=MMETSP1474-20131121/68116_1 /ASSEMBLY_ACC=CAM_ASM_001110 /TAXON_ID=97495 /ORGANISM="Imantonia sp., Strain RCC918" /LENGTH=112 /DNA_ID=CAMNT_0053594315 /DNA_START=668 /DNA_END=1003 /DNA_ORIENTATION=+